MAQIRATDPEAIENSKRELAEFSNIEFFQDPYEAIKGADLIVIATEWKNYSQLDLVRIKTLTSSRKIVDLRNLLNAQTLEDEGFDYDYIGKKSN